MQFWGGFFPNYVKRFIPNYNTLKYTHTSLKATPTKGSRFDWTETCNRAFKKLNSIWNSVNCFSYFHKSIYRIVHTDARPFV